MFGALALEEEQWIDLSFRIGDVEDHDERQPAERPGDGAGPTPVEAILRVHGTIVPPRATDISDRVNTAPGVCTASARARRFCSS